MRADAAYWGPQTLDYREPFRRASIGASLSLVLGRMVGLGGAQPDAKIDILPNRWGPGLPVLHRLHALGAAYSMSSTSAPAESDTEPHLSETGGSAALEAASMGGLSRGKYLAVWFLAFLALWAGITAWRWEIIDSPPYWDSAMGLFLEANFLAETGFDYRRLWFEERRFIEGGAAIYLTSILPTVVAVLMTSLDTPREVFIAYHLFTFACAAGVALLVVAICRPWAGWLGAALIGAAVLTTPVFSTQIDMLGMDLPMLLMALLSAWCAVQRKFFWAALAGCAAFLTKMSGGLVLGALFAPLLLDLALQYQGTSVRWRRRIWLFTSLACFVVAGIMLLDAWIGNLETSAVEQYEIDQTRGLTVMKDFLFWCPELVLIAAVIFMFWPVVTVYRVLALRRQGTTTREALHDVLLEDPIEVYSWTIVLGMLLVLSLAYSIPRYLILPLPFLYILGGRLLFRRQRVSWLSAAPFAILLGFNLANQDGRLYPAFPDEAKIDLRTGAALERSREYLADHRANQRAVQFLAENCTDRTIFAGNPFVHFLGLPRLGYVDEPLHGYSISTYSSDTFPTVEHLPEGEVSEPVFVHVSNRFNQNSLGLVPPPTPEDIVLWQDDHRESPVTIYQRRENPLSTADENHNRLISLVWPIERQYNFAQELIKKDETARATTVLNTLLDLDPNHHDARFALAGIQAAEGDFSAAAENYRRVIQHRDDVAEVRKAYADMLIASKDVEEAERQLWLAVGIDPEYFDGLQSLGILLMQREEYGEATEAFRRATKSRPKDARAWFLLGAARRRLGDVMGAIDALQQSLQLDPKAIETRQELGTALVMSGQAAEAIGHFQQVLSLQPGNDEVANNLAWILATWPNPSVRNGAAAVAIVEPRCQGPNVSAGSLDTLAAAYAEAGRFDEAVATATRALELARAAKNQALAEKIASRLRLYQQQRPFHAPPT